MSVVIGKFLKVSIFLNFFRNFQKNLQFCGNVRKIFIFGKNHRHHLKQCGTQCHMDVSVSSSYFMTSLLLFTYRWKQWLLMTCYPTKIVPRAICKSLRSWHIAAYFSLYNSWKTPTHSSPIGARYAVSFVCANLTKVLSLWLLCCVLYRMIYNPDTLRVYSAR